jgi:hypothetical protein
MDAKCSNYSRVDAKPSSVAVCFRAKRRIKEYFLIPQRIKVD